MSCPEERDLLFFPTYTVTRRGSAAVVAVDGEIDFATAPQVAAELRAVIDSTQTTSLSIDIRDVTFLGVAGLHAFVDTESHLRLTGGQIDIVCRDQDHRMFSLTGLDRSLNVRSASHRAPTHADEPGTLVH